MKLLYALLLIITVSCTTKQIDKIPTLPVDKSTGKITYTKTVNTPGLSSAGLDERIKKWFAGNAKLFNAVSQSEIGATGKCSFLKHNVVRDEKNEAHTIDILVSYDVFVKPVGQGAQVTLTNFSGTQSGSSIGAPIEGMYKALKYYGGQKPDNVNTQVRPMLISILTETDTQATKVLSSLEQAISHN